MPATVNPTSAEFFHTVLEPLKRRRNIKQGGKHPARKSKDKK